jgi:Glucodextranase, domain B
MQRDIIKKWAIIFFLFFFVIYGLYESYKIILGPKIYIDTPKNGQIFEKSLVEVKGSARNIAFMRLNDKPIFIDKEGRFNEKLILLPGYNIMTLHAEDRFKRIVEKRMHFYLRSDLLEKIPEIKNIETASTTKNGLLKNATSTATTTEN